MSQYNIKLFSFLALTLGLLLCSGCAKLGSFSTPALDTTSSFLSRRLDTPELGRFIRQTSPGTHPGQWDVDTLTLAALYYNPDLQSARDKLGLAKAGEITAGERPNPTFTFGPGRDTTLPKPTLFDLGLNLPIETGGKREKRLEQAQHLSSAAAYQIGAATWQVRSRVVHALVDLHAARANAGLYAQQAAVLSEVIKVFDERAAHGQLPTIAASQTSIAYQQALLNQADADKQAAEARASLAGAIGVSVAALDAVSLDTDSLERPAGGSMQALREAVRQHNGLLGSLAEYQAAQSALQLELAKRVPDINIGPGFEWTGSGDKFTLGLSVTLPLLNNNEGPVAEAVAKRKLAADAFNSLQANVIGGIELAGTSVKMAEAKLRTADRLLAAQKDKQEKLKAQLQPGEASRLPLLLGEAELATGELARESALVQALGARAALEEAAQQPQFGAAPLARIARKHRGAR
jgi:outer membrane protein TolC